MSVTPYLFTDSILDIRKAQAMTVLKYQLLEDLLKKKNKKK
jgi:hypothetical protein